MDPGSGERKQGSGMMIRKVLVTGGTGTIGQALVRRLASDYVVIFQYLHNESVAERLEEETGAQKWKADLEDENIRAPEGIAILINNVGINEGDERTSEVRESTWRRTIEINLTATWRLSRQCLPGMVAERWGRIVTISSIYGYRAAVGNLPYTVSKHGLRGLTTTVALEYGRIRDYSKRSLPRPCRIQHVEADSSRAGRRGRSG